MTRRAVLLFAVLCVLWGLPYLLIKIAVAEVSVPFLVFARVSVGALALLPFLIRNDLGWLRTHWLPTAAFCLTEMLLPWGLITHGETSIDSSTAGLLIALTPVVTIALARLTGSDERLGPRRWTGLVLGFIGVFILALPTLGGELLAVGEILLAAVCYAIGSIIAARWLKNVPAAQLTAVCLISAALVYALPALQTWPATMPSTLAIWSIASLGVFCTALAFTVYFMLVREAGPERAVLITYVAPAVAVAAGVVVLSEPLDARLIAAFALILGGSWLAASRNQPAKINPEKRKP